MIYGRVLLMLTYPKLLDGLNCESKGEENKSRRSWGAFFNSQHFEGRRVCWSFKMGTKKFDKQFIIRMDLHKPNNELVNV